MVSTAFSKASARTETVISSDDFMPFVKPLNNWDRITPELPLAPRKEPEEIALHKDGISMVPISYNTETSLAADIIVRVILRHKII